MKVYYSFISRSRHKWEYILPPSVYLVGRLPCFKGGINRLVLFICLTSPNSFIHLRRIECASERDLLLIVRPCFLLLLLTPNHHRMHISNFEFHFPREHITFIWPLDFISGFTTVYGGLKKH